MSWKAAFEKLLGKNGKTGKDARGIVNRVDPSLFSKERYPPIQLVIGLDFGTSFSKVVVGEARARYAVPFKEYASGKSALLVPSALSVLPGLGTCKLGTTKKRDSLRDNLKMPLIERNFSEEVQVPVVAYLALIFRHARQWLIDTHGSTYRGRKIEWFVNVGLPTDSYDDKELTVVYLGLVRSAWHASEMPGDVTLQTALASLKQGHADGSGEDGMETFLPDDRINAFPEFVAQLAAYVRSPRRRNGLHVMVDVGGGTLDVTVFNVHQNDDEDVYPVFARKVAPLRHLQNAPDGVFFSGIRRVF